MRLRCTAWLLAGLMPMTPGCGRETGRLTAAQEHRFAAEGLLPRADNQTFRWTQGAGRRGGTWEDRVASIVVTRRSVLVHENEKVGIEMVADSRSAYEVYRDGQRVRISGGSGADAETWAQDIRSVIRGSGGASP